MSSWWIVSTLWWSGMYAMDAREYNLNIHSMYGATSNNLLTPKLVEVAPVLWSHTSTQLQNILPNRNEAVQVILEYLSVMSIIFISVTHLCVVCTPNDHLTKLEHFHVFLIAARSTSCVKFMCEISYQESSWWRCHSKLTPFKLIVCHNILWNHYIH